MRSFLRIAAMMLVPIGFLPPVCGQGIPPEQGSNYGPRVCPNTPVLVAPKALVVQTTPVAPQLDDTLKKQVELLRKQLEAQQKTIQNLSEQVKNQSAGGNQLTQVEAFEARAKGSSVVQASALDAAQPDDTLRKQVDLLQKQVDTQQKMIQLLLDEVKKQPAGSALQTQVATLEARSKQAAQRDLELSQAIDNLTEQRDADLRRGPQLPAPLKELFLPTQTNESPLSIYGSVIMGYQQPTNGGWGRINSPDFGPYFLLQLNEKFLLEASIDINNAGVSAGILSVDWMATDWLTVVGGRFLTPIGFFNERLNHEWINKLPDVPLMFLQVSPQISTDGIMARGAFYLGDSPLKMEYFLYGGNGFQLPGTPAANGQLPLGQVTDLEAITGGPDEVTSKALGGRIGLWAPELGATLGISGYLQGHYGQDTNSQDAPDNIKMWGLDAGWHYGNWDFRSEFAHMDQQAITYIGNNIGRTGLYAQVAYRPYDCCHPILQKFEGVFRFGMVRFSGIDPALIDPTAFASPVDVPVNRNQYTFGLNYYICPSMQLKVAYEINYELGGMSLHDNVVLSQFVWAF